MGLWNGKLHVVFNDSHRGKVEKLWDLSEVVVTWDDIDGLVAGWNCDESSRTSLTNATKIRRNGCGKPSFRRPIWTQRNASKYFS